MDDLSSGYWVGVFVVSILMCMVTHWIRLVTSHEIGYRVFMTLTKLLYYISSQS